MFERYGTNPAATFLAELREKHDLPEVTFLVDQLGYWAALSIKLNGRIEYIDRNLTEE
jgi:putative transposase